MTTNLIDVQHADVIMCTNNMAENHPVGFQWVMKAKERGAKVIHVDPRFTRTSAVSDVHVPLRSGTNIAFFGGLMSYAIQNNLYFKDYVVSFTNASFLIDPAFKTPTDLGGLFEGLEKTGTITYALNLTQHTNGVQNIRALCMLQLLLGNIGRPGGGVTALRGHANVQGATDLEVLYHELPGYLPMPLRDAHPDLKTYLE